MRHCILLSLALVVSLLLATAKALTTRKYTFRNRCVSARSVPSGGMPPLSPACCSSLNDNDMSELYRRIDNLANADKLLQDSLLSSNDVSDDAGRAARRQRPSTPPIDLPVVAMDSLLPGQRLEGRTTDTTFGRFLGETIGIGGLFVMTSVNHSKRMLRRNGVIVKLEAVDYLQQQGASSSNTNGKKSTMIDQQYDRAPTAVDFALVAKCHCRLIGPSTGMKARVGRWRRSYDPDGEEAVLGWGEERFVDAFANATSVPETKEGGSENASGALIVDPDNNTDEQTESCWSANQVDCAIQDADNNDASLLDHVERILPLLEEWQALASNVHTYENTNVVATPRLLKGQPGLVIDPTALIRNVKQSLGDMPAVLEQNKDNGCYEYYSYPYTEFAFWGAALINPLPVALGVAPEIRGRILEAPDAQSRLKILEWGLVRSIRNLEGKHPL